MLKRDVTAPFPVFTSLLTFVKNNMVYTQATDVVICVSVVRGLVMMTMMMMIVLLL